MMLRRRMTAAWKAGYEAGAAGLLEPPFTIGDDRWVIVARRDGWRFGRTEAEERLRMDAPSKAPPIPTRPYRGKA